MKFAYMPDTHFGAYDQAAPSPQEAADAFEQVIEEAVLAEELGFDGVFLPERHARGETFVPSPFWLPPRSRHAPAVSVSPQPYLCPHSTTRCTWPNRSR